MINKTQLKINASEFLKGQQSCCPFKTATESYRFP